MKKIMMVAVAALALAGCTQSDSQEPTQAPSTEQAKPVGGDETKKDDNVSNAQLVTYEVKVDGMMCDGCKKHVTDILAAQEGVNDVTVDLKTGTAIVHVKPGATFDEAKAKDALDVDDYKLTACTRIPN
ncbi:MAG: heavy-metal-associated domain-containing protein [Planctomycetes bacterium]|nr:heavy-metal-associated domain-containing protein [Planctomycetota bacterium]